MASIDLLGGTYDFASLDLAGLVVNGDTYCTLTAIGNDNTGALIGFTSAHCGGPGAQVASETNPDNGVIGTMVSGNDSLDYAVIRFDPAKVQPVANYKGFLIDGIGPDPTFGEIACKLGRTTGLTYGVITGGGGGITLGGLLRQDRPR